MVIICGSCIASLTVCSSDPSICSCSSPAITKAPAATSMPTPIRRTGVVIATLWKAEISMIRRLEM